MGQRKSKDRDRNMMKYLSLFSGMGGFEMGIGDRGECVGFSEINRPAIAVYKLRVCQCKNCIFNRNLWKQKNHEKFKPCLLNLGDITKINIQELPDFDLLVGGFPCQSFSVAGKRGGFQDTRGTLFFNIAEIIKEKRPKNIVLENVKGLLYHDKGNTLEIILSTLQEIGYLSNWEIYNSKDFGVPQNRQRIYFICTHIKQLLEDGQLETMNISKTIIQQYLFQILLNNLTEVKKLQEHNSKDWVMGWLLLKEINQNLEKSEKNVNTNISIFMGENGCLLKESAVWQNIDIWLNKELGENSIPMNPSIILTAIKQIIDQKTFTYSQITKAMLLATILLKNLSKDSWHRILSNLIIIQEDTNYVKIHHQDKKTIVTETGSTYFSENFQSIKQRVYIVGYLRGKSKPKIFHPLEKLSTIIKKDKTRICQAETLTCRDFRNGQSGNIIAETLTKEGAGHWAKCGSNVIQVKEGTIKGYDIAQNGDSINLAFPNMGNARRNTRRGRVGHREVHTLDTSCKQGILQGQTFRNLTPIECEKLQGFPPGWSKFGSYEKGDMVWNGEIKINKAGQHAPHMVFLKEDMVCRLLDSERYKLCGNAVTTSVVSYIINNLIDL